MDDLEIYEFEFIDKFGQAIKDGFDRLSSCNIGVDEPTIKASIDQRDLLL